MSDKRVYLIRHAHPDYPGGVKMCLGQKCDLPLSAVGRQQAKRLADLFAPVKIDAVYASPLTRARQTAEAIAGGKRPLHILDDLIELSGGAWDGLTFDEIHARFPECFARGARPFCPPGGESDEQGFARAFAALERIRLGRGACAAAVAHGAIIRTLLCGLLGRPMSEKRHIAQDHAAINILEYHDGRWTVTDVNLTAEILRRRYDGA